MEKTCTSCGAALREGAKFCRNCGAKVTVAPRDIFCDQCGAKNPEGSPFCDECGARLTDEATTSSSWTTADAWGSSDDGWGDTLGALSAALEEETFSAFTYEKRPDGSVIITGLADRYATNIEIPAGATVIAAEAFTKTNLISVKLPEGITTIDRRAFYGCELLESLTLPSSVRIIGDEAFSCCKSLEIEAPATARVGASAFVGTKTQLLKVQEAERRAAEERARIEAEAAEAAKRAAEAARVEAERRAAEQARVAAEQARAAAERAAKEAAERKAREEKAAAERAAEQARINAANAAAERQRMEPVWMSNVNCYVDFDPTVPECYRSPAAVEWLKENYRLGLSACIILAKCYIFGMGTAVDGRAAYRILEYAMCQAENARAKDMRIISLIHSLMSQAYNL